MAGIPAAVSDPLRLGVVRDFRAERWPSMDLCADELLREISGEAGEFSGGEFSGGEFSGELPFPGSPRIAAADLAPPFRRRFSRLLARNAAFNADRLLNRHLDLPHFLRRIAPRFDFFHVVDHTYAHVVRALPPGRAGVYCHDLNAFRCLLEPDREPRPWWFRQLARRTLAGLAAAAVVFYSTAAVRDELLRSGHVRPDRLVRAPYGVAVEFAPHAAGPVAVPVGMATPFLLHVGANVPRKRLDVLLDVFAGFRRRVPNVRLVQVGGPWPAALAVQIHRLGIETHVTQVRDLTREQLAELYRRAAAVLVTSDAEGFGLPVIEALACGAAVVASDLATLREAGGSATIYCPVADVTAWVEAVTRLLVEPAFAPPREVRLAHAARFSWHEHARVIGATYLDLASRVT